MYYLKKIKQLSLIINDIVCEGGLSTKLRVLVEEYLDDIDNLFRDLKNETGNDIEELMNERNDWESEYDKCQLHIENMESEIRDLQEQVTSLENEINNIDGK